MMKDEDEFLRTELNYGLLVRGELNQIQRFKERIAEELSDSDDIRIVYQKLSASRLTIKESNGGGKDGI